MSDLELTIAGTAVLRALDPVRLECGAELVTTLCSPENLRTVMPDFPVSAGAR